MICGVAITGMGAVSSLGDGCEALASAMLSGRTGVRRLLRFSTAPFSVSIGGLVPDREAPSRDHAALALDFAERALREALADAEIESPTRAALVLGTSSGDGSSIACELTRAIAERFGIEGPRITVSTACTSSTHALGIGRDLIESGEVDLAIAGGTDVLTPTLFAGFHALGVLSEAPCLPFSARIGTSLAEGAGFVVMERAASARARGVEARAALLGYGLSGDAYHETSPHPSGRGVALAIRNALEDAELEPDGIGYVNAHGTGTAANDPAEWRALLSVFDGRARSLPVSSSKGHLGHAQGAAGVLETIVTILCLERGLLPPNLAIERKRSEAPDDLIQGSRAAGRTASVICNSAFGGANCTVVVGPPGERATRQRSGVFVLGAAVIAERPDPRSMRIRGLDPRDLDPSSSMLLAAVVGALQEAELEIAGDLRERTGLVVGLNRPSPSAADELAESKQTRGLARLSVSAFARMVLNASAGLCARVLSIRGPQTALSFGSASGLFAIAHAAEILAARRDADQIVAGGIDEDEGAACALLSRVPSSMRLVGWAIAGPGATQLAVERALARAGVLHAEILQSDGSSAFASACAFVEAVRSKRRACLVASDPGLGCCAVVLERSDHDLAG